MPTCAAAAGFDYDISDGNGGSDTGHVAVDRRLRNDAPAAVDDTASGTEDTPLTIDPADLLADDTDVDGDTLSVPASRTPAAARSSSTRHHHLHA